MITAERIFGKDEKGHRRPMAGTCSLGKICRGFELRPLSIMQGVEMSNLMTLKSITLGFHGTR